MPSPHFIFLTGFMGSGKTTLGKDLASLLNYRFIDVDAFIEQQEKQTISSIFETKGEAYFRNIESECLGHLIIETESTVVALGGGTICFNDNLEAVKKRGLLVYLDVPSAELSKRLANSNIQRPILQKYSGAALLNEIESILSQRMNYYKQAHLIVNGVNLNSHSLSKKISEFIEQKNN